MSRSGRGHSRGSAGTINPAMDRRLVCRYTPAFKDVVLTTMASGALVDHAAEFENVSMQGCLVKTRHNPHTQKDDRVWLKVPGEIGSPVMEGAVVSAVKPFLARCEIRIRFLEPLTYQTFKRLVYGEEGLDLNHRERPAHEHDQFWR